jgi:SpoVK/Ycf46/Vps4 family AAA+-type ATPase
MLKIEIYLDEKEDELLAKAVEKSLLATYSAFCHSAAMKEAIRIVEKGVNEWEEIGKEKGEKSGLQGM